MLIWKLMKTGLEVGRMQTMTYTMEYLLMKMTMQFLWKVTKKGIQLKTRCQTVIVTALN